MVVIYSAGADGEALISTNYYRPGSALPYGAPEEGRLVVPPAVIERNMDHRTVQTVTESVLADGSVILRTNRYTEFRSATEKEPPLPGVRTVKLQEKVLEAADDDKIVETIQFVIGEDGTANLETNLFEHPIRGKPVPYKPDQPKKSGSVVRALGSGSTPLVSSVNSFGASRNNWSGWVGLYFAIGSSPITVTDLGRYVLSGNSSPHTVKLFYGDGTAVPGGETTVYTSGQPAGQFAYGALTSAITLQANTTYVLMSLETSGLDSWYDYGGTSITLNSVANSPWACYANQTCPPYYGVAANQSYGPVNLLFTSGGAGDDYGNNTSTAANISLNSSLAGAIDYGGDEDFFRVQFGSSGTFGAYTTGSTDTYGYLLDSGGNVLTSSDDNPYPNFGYTYSVSAGTYYIRVRHYANSGTGAYTLYNTFAGGGGGGGGSTILVVSANPSGTLRNDFGGWVGFQFYVGSSGLTVTELGRWIVSGNSGSHTLKLVRSDGIAVPNGEVSLNTQGQTPGQFAYATLSTPATLNANTTYALLSLESSDLWYDLFGDPVTLSTVASSPWAAYGYSYSSYTPAYAGSGLSYGPLNLRYSTGSGGNTPPTISTIANQTVPINSSTGPISFTVGDAETPVGSLNLTSASGNTTLVPNANISFGGSGANRTATVTPAGNQVGSATITVTVTDGGGLTANRSFNVSVPSDYDADGLPDTWEYQYFSSLSQNGSGDWDGDGITNLQEYQNGTNPGSFTGLLVFTPLH